MNSSVRREYRAASGDVDRRGVCRFGLETAGNCDLALYYRDLLAVHANRTVRGALLRG
jgi:hypothetical protein